MKKTGWYRGDQKPVRFGVYERDYKDGIGIHYCYWDGYEFHNGWTCKRLAMYDDAISCFKNLPWRGITKGSK